MNTFITKPALIEQWAPVVGWEGLYEVSDMGRVRSLRLRSFTEKRQGVKVLTKNTYGYLKVNLYKGSSQRTSLVHRLVLESFIGPSELQCNHKNGDKQDNFIENLEWLTPAENTAHSLRVLGVKKPKGEANGFSKLTEDQVRRIREERLQGKTFRALAEDYRTSVGTVYNVVARKLWQHV